LTAALDGIVAPEHLSQPWPSHQERAPLWKAAGQRRYVYRSAVRYGDHPSQLLDVWRTKGSLQKSPPCSSSCLAGPGCSAGGHLATLAGLTANVPQWQAELPADADTSVDAVVSVYGLYDWHDRSTRERDRFMGFLERVVVKRSQTRHPEVFRAASPTERVHSFAPPFLAVHGSDDGIIPVGEARAFVDRMRTVSEAAVGYIELPGVGHGFDLTDGERTAPVVAAIGRFLNQIHQDRPGGKVISAV